MLPVGSTREIRQSFVETVRVLAVWLDTLDLRLDGDQVHDLRANLVAGRELVGQRIGRRELLLALSSSAASHVGLGLVGRSPAGGSSASATRRQAATGAGERR